VAGGRSGFRGSRSVLLALIYRDHGGDAIRFTRSDAQACTIAYRRRTWQEAESYTFTWQDAEQAKLTVPAVDRNGNPTAWHKYPQAMLRARCISAVARMAFPDTIAGLYTPEELGATVDVNDEGTVVSTAMPTVTVERTPATEKQRKYIDYLMGELGWDVGRLSEFAREWYVDLLTLSRDEASALVEELKEQVEGRKPEPEPEQAQTTRPQQEAINLLHHLRSQVAALGGEEAKRPLTVKQIKAMSVAELEGEITATEEQLEALQVQVANEETARVAGGAT
jgi:hypothetical protein